MGRAWTHRVFVTLVFMAAIAHGTPAIAGPYTRLQILLPGETAAPGTTARRDRNAATADRGRAVHDHRARLRRVVDHR